MKILLVEDSKDTQILVESSLKGYEVTSIDNITEAKGFLESNTIDLMILDINLPDGSGFDFCNELSANNKYANLPIIILSTKDQVSDKVMGLYSGADDYVTKPFSSQELKARVDARFRRLEQREGNFESQGYEFDLEYQKVTRRSDGKDLNLTPTEFRILYTLIKNPNKAHSRQELVKSVWESKGLNIEPRGLDTHISHLRNKLDNDSEKIVSIYGKGYSFKIAA